MRERRSPTVKKAPSRRMGAKGSDNWHAMLDGAEAILREEGYAALTSRRVAERIGVKQRLVYYYFHTMDDLVVQTFRRLSVRELERLRLAQASDSPLREIWNVAIHTTDARLISEFMALAGRVDTLRAEVVTFIEESRRIQVEVLSRSVVSRAAGSIPPVATAIIATSLALTLLRETSIGVTTGHVMVRQVIDDHMKKLEAARSGSRLRRA